MVASQYTMVDRKEWKALKADARRWHKLWELLPDRFQIVMMPISNGVSSNSAIDAAAREK